MRSQPEFWMVDQRRASERVSWRAEAFRWIGTGIVLFALGADVEQLLRALVP